MWGNDARGCSMIHDCEYATKIEKKERKGFSFATRVHVRTFLSLTRFEGIRFRFCENWYLAMGLPSPCAIFFFRAALGTFDVEIFNSRGTLNFEAFRVWTREIGNSNDTDRKNRGTFAFRNVETSSVRTRGERPTFPTCTNFSNLKLWSLQSESLNFRIFGWKDLIFRALKFE